MSWYFDRNVHADKAAAERKLTARRKKGEALEPIVLTAKRDISTTFWGKAWNINLMSYSDFENRMPRGRTYLRGGKVLGLQIEKGAITSTVLGSALYDVKITITPLKPTEWQSLREDCAGQVGTLVELLSGKLSDAVMHRVSRLGDGLFPRPKDIRIQCSCPDYADCCKHAAATLYAVSVCLDKDPSLLFALREVDASELIGSSSAKAVDAITGQADVAGDLAGEDLSALFGIDLGDVEAASAVLDAAMGLAPQSPPQPTAAAVRQVMPAKKAAKKSAAKAATKAAAKAAKKAAAKSTAKTAKPAAAKRSKAR